jgi:hypothetical protein
MSYFDAPETAPILAPIVTVVVSPRTALSRWLLARAREASTWRSLGRLSTLLLILIWPDKIAEIGAIGVAATEVLGVLLPDRVLGGAATRITDPGQPGQPGDVA